jgi:hypothetical protein
MRLTGIMRSKNLDFRTRDMDLMVGVVTVGPQTLVLAVSLRTVDGVDHDNVN